MATNFVAIIAFIIIIFFIIICWMFSDSQLPG